VLRAVRFHLQSILFHSRAVVRLGERSRILVDMHRYSSLTALYGNPPDMPEMLAWRRVLRDGDLFIDVGANVGIYTIWAAELGAQVIALEPAPDAFALLRENIDLNGYQVTTVQAAAGDHCGTARFSAGRDVTNRLDPAGEVETRLMTIDSLVGDRYVAGMKVDVEGFEIDVLRGCTRALADRRIGLIQLEWNATSQRAVGTDRQPVADLLAAYGYQLYRPDHGGRLFRIPRPGFGADVFALPAAGGSA
jgi:FkbM family methyltransferase